MNLSIKTDTFTNYLQHPTTLPINIKPELSPEDQLNQDKENEATQKDKKEQAEKKEDKMRKEFVDYLEYNSKKTQAEIYLAVELENNPISNLIKSLQNMQKQNEMAEAYAEYENNHTQVA